MRVNCVNPPRRPAALTASRRAGSTLTRIGAAAFSRGTRRLALGRRCSDALREHQAGHGGAGKNDGCDRAGVCSHKVREPPRGLLA